MRVYEVIPNVLYMSRFPTLKLADLAALKEVRIDTIVCLATRRRSADVAQVLGLKFVALPISDGRLTPAHLAAADRVFSLVADGSRRVLVHCLGARNRAPLVSALVFSRWHGVSKPVALAHIRRVKPKTIFNKSFDAYLSEGT